MRVIIFEALHLLCLILLHLLILLVVNGQLRINPEPRTRSVRVQVDQKLFLVVFYPNRTVAWLEDQVAEHYFNETGVKVSVKIRDVIGAKMFSDDILWNMVKDGDHIRTDVTVKQSS